ncbi:MAG TPA: cation diffusion facilitator family transporter [Clostridia bacterium]|nr:cation diffusion facilitator family transporter [Clostridia bacterium]
MNNIVSRSTDYFIMKFIKNTGSDKRVTNPLERRKYAYLEAYVSIAGNLVLAAIKVVMGLMLNSISLLADAAHTAADVLTSIVVLLGFKLSNSPADEKHPYGHGRIEFIATLIISVMLLAVGFEFGKSSYVRLISNTAVKGSYAVAFIMLLGAVFKEWMARFSIDLGYRTNATALIADAWHHRTDGIASLLVAAAIIASRYGYYKVDAIFGLLVSALIFYTGISISKEAVSKLIGEVPEEEELQNIESIALSISGVSGIHKINVHNYGCYKEISLHVQVDNDMSLIKAHDISEQVERSIESNIECRATVHIEPVELINIMN